MKMNPAMGDTKTMTVTVYVDDATYRDESKRKAQEAFMRSYVHPDADEVSLEWEQSTNTNKWFGTLTYKRRTNLDILGLLHKYAGYDKLKLEAANEIESLRVAYNQALATIEDITEERDQLRNAGDILAATGGQHGFDEALDNWKAVRGE
jgi:hypothetical protein